MDNDLFINNSKTKKNNKQTKIRGLSSLLWPDRQLLESSIKWHPPQPCQSLDHQVPLVTIVYLRQLLSMFCEKLYFFLLCSPF